MARQPAKTTARERKNPEKEFCNNQFKPIQAKNEMQKKYLNAMKDFTVVFGLGPAGTGKSICSMGWALGEVYAGRTDKIIITRPAVEVGAGLGFLPGTQEEKFAPWIGIASMRPSLISISVCDLPIHFSEIALSG